MRYAKTHRPIAFALEGLPLERLSRVNNLR